MPRSKRRKGVPLGQTLREKKTREYRQRRRSAKHRGRYDPAKQPREAKQRDQERMQ